jgi:hypothetical protein
MPDLALSPDNRSIRIRSVRKQPAVEPAKRRKLARIAATLNNEAKRALATRSQR